MRNLSETLGKAAKNVGPYAVAVALLTAACAPTESAKTTSPSTLAGSPSAEPPVRPETKNSEWKIFTSTTFGLTYQVEYPGDWNVMAVPYPGTNQLYDVLKSRSVNGTPTEIRSIAVRGEIPLDELYRRYRAGLSTRSSNSAVVEPLSSPSTQDEHGLNKIGGYDAYVVKNTVPPGQDPNSPQGHINMVALFTTPGRSWSIILICDPSIFDKTRPQMEHVLKSFNFISKPPSQNAG